MSTPPQLIFSYDDWAQSDALDNHYDLPHVLRHAFSLALVQLGFRFFPVFTLSFRPATDKVFEAFVAPCSHTSMHSGGARADRSEVLHYRADDC